MSLYSADSYSNNCQSSYR